jgi:transposase-like protein
VNKEEIVRLKRLLLQLSIKEVKRFLLEAHLEAGKTKTEAAADIGVSEKTIYNWINEGLLDIDIADAADINAGTHHRRRRAAKRTTDQRRDPESLRDESRRDQEESSGPSTGDEDPEKVGGSS